MEKELAIGNYQIVFPLLEVKIGQIPIATSYYLSDVYIILIKSIAIRNSSIELIKYL